MPKTIDLHLNGDELIMGARSKAMPLIRQSRKVSLPTNSKKMLFMAMLSDFKEVYFVLEKIDEPKRTNSFSITLEKHSDKMVTITVTVTEAAEPMDLEQSIKAIVPRSNDQLNKVIDTLLDHNTTVTLSGVRKENCVYQTYISNYV